MKIKIVINQKSVKAASGVKERIECVFSQMTVTNWYQSGEHENFAPKTQAGPVEDPTDVLSVYRTHEHKRRERAVKIAHFRLIEDKLRVRTTNLANTTQPITNDAHFI